MNKNFYRKRHAKHSKEELCITTSGGGGNFSLLLYWEENIADTMAKYADVMVSGKKILEQKKKKDDETGYAKTNFP